MTLMDSRRWAVGVADPPCRLRTFDTEDEAVAFVGTLEGVENGIYYCEPLGDEEPEHDDDSIERAEYNAHPETRE